MKYIKVSSVEEVINTPGTCFVDEKNILHIHSPNPSFSSPKYAYKAIRNLPVEDDIKLERGEENSINQFFEYNN